MAAINDSFCRLAYCELFLCLAALTLRVFPFLETHETEYSDVKYYSDALVGRPRPGSKGVRVVMVDQYAG